MNDRIGPYQISSELGRGGMGVVYLAHDTRLDRQVAIKMLPEHLASDPVRMERFEREAKTLAGLSHPNIAGIYGIEEQEGAKFLVLEFVDGETLAERLDRGPLPVDEAVEHAAQIAAGVQAAHDAGVIHRDLKPANIKITSDGVAKVLDFGLARADESVSSSGTLDQPTLTMQHQHSPTIEGAILGTAAYMSPEQARGRRVDKRTDIWSFGVLLYEMLIGASPFIGETASDSIGAVLHKEFNFDLLPAQTPLNVRRVLERCLQRDKNLRYRDIGDARLDLLTPVHAETSSVQKTGAIAWTVAAVFLMIAVAMLGYTLTRPAPAVPPPVNFSFEVPLARASFTSIPSVAITADGQSIAIQADNDGYDPIYVRHLNRDGLIRIESPWAENPELIRWTMDGKSLIVLRGQITQGELWKISLTGDAPRLICSLPDEGFLWRDSVAYLDDETLIVGYTTEGLWTVPERGGSIKQYLAPAAEGEIHVQPQVLPDSDAIVFFEVNSGTLELYKDGKRRTLYDFKGDRLSQFDVASDGSIYVSIYTGHLARGTYRLDLDPDRLEVTGDPFLLFPMSDIDVADNGSMVRAPRVDADPVMRELVWVNPDGTVAEVVAENMPNGTDVALSPDGTRAAVSIISSSTLGSDQRNVDIAVVDLQTGARYELEDSSGNDYYPSWYADGKRLIYSTYNAGIRRSSQRLASGTDQPSVVFERSLIARPSDDGRYVLSNIAQVSYLIEGEDEAKLIDGLSTSDFDLSSNSRFLAYSLGDNGEGLRIQRFPEGGARTTVTTMDVRGINWSHDDTKIYFWAQDAMWEAPVDISGSQPIVNTPTKLFDKAKSNLVSTRIYGVADDGRFLMLKNPDDMPSAPETIAVHVGLGWLKANSRD